MPNLIFSTSISVSNEVALSQAGDTITIGYETYGNKNIDITSFDNLALTMQ
jgi:hypothetical protein